MGVLHQFAPCYGEASGSYRDKRWRFKAALEYQMPGILQFVPQSIPREPLSISP